MTSVYFYLLSETKLFVNLIDINLSELLNFDLSIASIGSEIFCYESFYDADRRLK